jgi:glycosyltransferase involved in cell wall biosynthesis
MKADDAQETHPIPLISVVVPVRNRAASRLENCLRPLRWQDLPQEQVERVVSDFGSDAA